MSKNKELAKNTLIILFGKFCTQFLSFFLLPLYTKVLSTSEYGTFDLISTYVALVIPLITLELSNALFRFLIDVRGDESNKKHVFTNIMIGIIVLAIISISLLLVVNIFFKIDYLNYIIFNIISTIMITVALQAARGLGKNIDYTVGSMICAITTIALNILFLIVFKMRVEGMLLSLGIANLIASIYLFFKLKIYNLFDLKVFSKNKLKEALVYSAPLVPNSISWWIISVSDRTMVSIIINVAANGIYSIANKFSGLFMNIYSVFNLSFTESAALYINDEDKDEFFSNTINTILKLFSCLGLGVIVILPFVYNILINKQYADGYNYVPLLIIGAIFNIIVSLFGSIYVAKKLTKEVGKTSAFAAIINIAINLFAIKWVGIYGACLSTIAAFAAMAIYRYVDVQKYVKIKIESGLVIIISIMFAISVTLYYINNILGNIFNLVLVIGVSIYLNKSLLKKGYEIIMNRIRK